MGSQIANQQSRINRITVIGAGTMGHGIAQVAAMAGCETRLTDSNPQAIAMGWDRIQTNLAGAVERGKLTREQADAAAAKVTPVTTLDVAARDADLVIEAVLEDLAVKQALFQQLDGTVSDTTILATN